MSVFITDSLWFTLDYSACLLLGVQRMLCPMPVTVRNSSIVLPRKSIYNKILVNFLYRGILSTFQVVGFCPLFRLWDFVHFSGCGILSCGILSVGILSCGILSCGILSGYREKHLPTKYSGYATGPVHSFTCFVD